MIVAVLNILFWWIFWNYKCSYYYYYSVQPSWLTDSVALRIRMRNSCYTWLWNQEKTCISQASTYAAEKLCHRTTFSTSWYSFHGFFLVLLDQKLENDLENRKIELYFITHYSWRSINRRSKKLCFRSLHFLNIPNLLNMIWFWYNNYSPKCLGHYPQ